MKKRTEFVARAASRLGSATGRRQTRGPDKTTVHIPGLLVQGKEVDRVAGKTDGIRDRNNSAESENLFLGSLAGSGFERVAFNNQLEILMHF